MSENAVGASLQRMGRIILVALAGGIPVYLLVLAIEWLILLEPPGQSLHLLAVFAGYVVFSLVALRLWRKQRRELLQAHASEVERAREEAFVEASQRLVHAVADRVTGPNAEIVKWVQRRKARGKQVARPVEDASRSISEAMSLLSEMAYVRPYINAKWVGPGQTGISSGMSLPLADAPRP